MASEEVTLEVLKSKCIPGRFWLSKSYFKSLDSDIVRFLVKLFRSSNIEVMAECPRYFGFSLPSKLTQKKEKYFYITTIIRPLYKYVIVIFVKFISVLLFCSLFS